MSSQVHCIVGYSTQCFYILTNLLVNPAIFKSAQIAEIVMVAIQTYCSFSMIVIP